VLVRPGAHRGGGTRAGAVLAAMVLAAVLTVPGTSAGSGTCDVTVPAGDVTALALALENPDTGCAVWTVRVSGTYTLSASLNWTPSVPLRLVGPDDTTARIAATIPAGTPGHRLLTVAAIGAPQPVTLERLVLAGGDVSEVDVTDPSAFGSDEGGAVLAFDLTLVDVELVGNSAKLGGAVSTVDLTAVRTSFIANEAINGDPDAFTALGGAVFASGAVTLTNVTFADNRAGAGGAIALYALPAPFDPASLAATSATFLGSGAEAAGRGSHLDVIVEPGASATVALRGVLLGPLAAAPVVTAGPACVLPDTTVTLTDTFSADRSCEGAGDTTVVPAIADLSFERVTFLPGPTPGTTDLYLPVGDWPGRDAVSCVGTGVGDWPGEDQRRVTRPQGTLGRCDAGAVEREVAAPLDPPVDPPVDPVDPVDPPAGVTDAADDEDGGAVDDGAGGAGGEQRAAEDGRTEDAEGAAAGGAAAVEGAGAQVVAGPVPTSVPAGGGGCADGCP